MNEAPPRVSVIIATRDRPTKLAETVMRLTSQQASGLPFEVLVVDDGSTPPVGSEAVPGVEPVRLVRLAGVGRSGARNAGAGVALGAILIFIDDDITASTDFVEQHSRAHREWGHALITGAIKLPNSALRTPFGRFRQALEDEGLPRHRGPAPAQNFCAAGNMSIPREDFLALGGFDTGMSSAEDQDLALRHVARGGVVAYLPEAVGIHRDEALDLRSYCERAEWGMQNTVAFLLKYPDLPENIARVRVNGPINWLKDGGVATVRKLAKAILGVAPVLEGALFVAGLLERVGASPWLLERTYRTLLGVHLARGLRRGLAACRIPRTQA
jgi:glycosyltransferase involved in cell wall biosynthesis